MTNAEVVAAWPKLKLLKNEAESLEAQIEKLQAQQEQLKRDLDTLDRVDEIFDLVALNVIPSGHGCDISAAAWSENRRRARVYLNAHTEKDWGLELSTDGQDRCGKWCGTGWPEDAALLHARRWVANNVMPSKLEEDMAKTRHEVDPSGRATRRRRDAFEAAFMAGNKELAVEILTSERSKLRAQQRFAKLRTQRRAIQQ